MSAVEIVAKKYAGVRDVLSERARRLWAGTEADALGRGGVVWVARATGMAISTVRKGRDEVRRGQARPLVKDRAPGAGRTPLEKKHPGLVMALDALVNPTTRGDPESPLRWTCKSVRRLAIELKALGLPVSATKVRELLAASGYSLMANAKTTEGESHPDRNAQFEFINAKAEDFTQRGAPVISVDAKKKEVIEENAGPGREWEHKGKPLQVRAHDFFNTDAAKAIPYGVYDVAKNLGFVNVGTDGNTPTFAVRSIEKWWDQMGMMEYPQAKEVFITADSGGNNSRQSHVWKTQLQALADRTGLTIHVSHFPPGTSKWNKIEHRLFSFISLNWRGRPLTSYEIIVSLIGATQTSKGLKVKAQLDLEKYPLGRAARKAELQALLLERAAFHGEWNYILRPRSAEQLAEAQAAIQREQSQKTATWEEARARWKKLFQEQQLSGLNHSRFCSERGVTYGAYIKARRKLYGPIQSHVRKTK